MASSSVIKMDGDEEKPTDEWRTSTTHFLTRGQTSMVSLNRVGGGGGGGGGGGVHRWDCVNGIIFVKIYNNY
jgi:hypothetical protein